DRKSRAPARAGTFDPRPPAPRPKTQAPRRGWTGGVLAPRLHNAPADLVTESDLVDPNRTLQLRRRHRSKVRLRDDPLGGRGDARRAHARAAARRPGAHPRPAVPDVRTPAAAAHERGDLRVRRQRRLRRGLLLEPAVAEGADVQRRPVEAAL